MLNSHTSRKLSGPSRTSRPSSQNLAKSVSVTNARTERQCSKNERKLTRKINNKTLIKCICHKGLNRYPSVVARSSFRVGGQLTTPQSLTAHTLDRYAQAVKRQRHSEMTIKIL